MSSKELKVLLEGLSLTTTTAGRRSYRDSQAMQQQECLHEERRAPGRPWENPPDIHHDGNAEEHQTIASKDTTVPRESIRRTPDLTEAATQELENTILEFREEIERQAQRKARDWSMIDLLHIKEAIELVKQGEKAQNNKISWLCGIFSGCVFSLLLTSLTGSSPLSPWAHISLLLVFSISLVVGWHFTQ